MSCIKCVYSVGVLCYFKTIINQMHCIVLVLESLTVSIVYCFIKRTRSIASVTSYCRQVLPCSFVLIPIEWAYISISISLESWQAVEKILCVVIVAPHVVYFWPVIEILLPLPRYQSQCNCSSICHFFNPCSCICLAQAHLRCARLFSKVLWTSEMWAICSIIR